MNISVQRFQAEKVAGDAVVVFLPQDEEILGQQFQQMRELWPLTAGLFDSKDFSGAKDSTVVTYTGNTKAPRLILVGLGSTATIDAERLRRASATGAQRAVGLKCSSITVVLPSLASIAPADVAQAVVEGVTLGTYSFDKWFTTNQDRTKLKKVTLQVENDEDVKEAKRGAAVGEAIASGVILARDLANAPSNEVDPAELVERAKDLQKYKVKVEALEKKQLQKLGMGGLLGVNQGSERPPFLIIMEWNGGKKGDKPVVLVGKGITFDSGGISIKPAAGMGEMKMDMGGAAAVIGTMRAVAELNLPVNVVALVPTTENMPSGSAYKPGDVLRFINGKTAEIDNTDAEGRLVLADALGYATRYNPAAVIDCATLTGAVLIALGNVGSAVMGNNAELIQKIRDAGNRTYERVVELPLWEEYEELIKSDVADVKNSGGRSAGTITAALFLQHFIGDYPWAHIDIAGTAMVSKGSGYINKGGTGVPVRLLVDLLRNWN
jgi:leucyl aminopeptidase